MPEEATPEAIDYSALIVADPPGIVPELPAEPDPEPVAETPTEPETPEETPAAPEPDKKPDHKNGTPDVALQKAQQKLTSIGDRLDKVLEKIEARGTEPTPEEVKKLQSLKTEKGELEALIADGREADPFADQPIIIKRQIESEKRYEEQQKRIDALEASQKWRDIGDQYQGVDVKTLWEKATKDAADIVARKLERIPELKAELTSAQALRMHWAEAMELFEARAADAHKSIKAKSGKAPEPPQTARTNRPSTTPGGARVSVASRSPAGVAKADPYAITAADYANLFKPD